MSEPFYNFQTVLDRVAPSIDTLVQELFPGARRNGASFRTGSETGDKGRSFSISTRSNNAGSFLDYADPSVKGNAIALVGLARNLSYQEAGKWLAQFLNVPPEERLEMPKKRPTPKIDTEKKTIQITSDQPGKPGWVVEWGPLEKKSIDYAASRGITEETLKLFRVASANGSIALPHFDEAGKLVMLKLWSCDGQKKILSNLDPVPVLFGKHLIDPMKTGGILIITEGHWDAMSWVQCGFPAVSIPNGCQNEEWISEDYTFLNQFSQIYLDFDDDQAGREAETKAKQRLGYERCKAIRYRYKDANDALKAGDSNLLALAFKEAEEAPIERIVKAADIKSKVRDRLNKHHIQKGIPFFLPKMPFEFRVHEVTLWFGSTSHGKSTILSNQIAFMASLGEMAMVASFEQTTPMTMAGMLVQYTSNSDIGQLSDFDAAYDELASRVLFYDSITRTNAAELIATMTLAHKQLGITQFVIDNVMTLEMDRQDNTAQAEVADLIRVFAAQYPVHVHVVAHPRKPKDDVSKPPGIQEIRGASEWGDMANNVITVYRDVSKAEKISSMRDEPGTFSEEDIQNFYESCPDGKILVRKQRETGHLPVITYFFDTDTKRAWKDKEDMIPYWFPDQGSEAA